MVVGILIVHITNSPLHAQHAFVTTTANPYEALDKCAREATSDEDVGLLVDKIFQDTVGAVAPALKSRVVSAQLSFARSEDQKALREESLAKAVNELGHALIGNSFTGTNTLQVHLLRERKLADIPYLLLSPTSSHETQKQTHTPTGGLFIALLLLRQKLMNPAWFGDPDTQNRVWLDSACKSKWKPEQIEDYLRVLNTDEQAKKAALILQDGLTRPKSSVIEAFQAFLTTAGVKP